MITTRFSDFVEINPAYSLTKRAKYPFVPMEAVAPGRRYVDAQQVREFTGGGAKFTSGDTLFARITPCLENGKIAQFKAPEGQMGFGSTEFIVVRAREGVSDPGFVYYLCLTDIIRKPAEKSMSGASGRQRADVKVVRDIEFVPPSLPTQRKIADILSAYDDLIENNTRRIKILEEMAQMIYREWFVHFRFPGHEQVEMVETELGLAPEGWEVKPVVEAVEFNPSIKIEGETVKPYVPMEALPIGTMVIAMDKVQLRSGNSGSKFRNHDTLLARITPSLENGKTGFVQFLPSDDLVAIGSTEFIVMRSRTLVPEYVYFLARDDGFRGNAIKSMTGASGRQRVQMLCFDGYKITQPDSAILERFARQIRPLFQFISNLAVRNANLRRTRDLLLPKVVSGEVEVDQERLL